MSDLTPQKKLAWLGLKDAVEEQSVIEKEIALLRENFTAYSAFKSMVAGESDYSGFETGLENNGFTTEEAATFSKKCQDNFTDEDSSGSSYDEFSIHTQDAGGYSEFKSGFTQNTSFSSRVETESGDVAAAGVEVHDTSGTTRDGVRIPAGGIEIFGREVHFSQTGPTKTGPGSGTGSGGGTGPVVEVTNIETKSGSQVFTTGETVTFEITVESMSNYEEDFTVTLFEDGTNVKSIALGAFGSGEPSLSPGEVRTIELSTSKSQTTTHDYRANDSSTTTVSWVPSGLTR